MSLFLDKLNETKVTPQVTTGENSVSSKLLLKLKNKLKEKEQSKTEENTAETTVESTVKEENTENKETVEESIVNKTNGSEDAPDGEIVADPPTVITTTKAEEPKEEENTSDTNEETKEEVKVVETEEKTEEDTESTEETIEETSEEEHQEEEKPKKRGRRKKKETTIKKETSDDTHDSISDEVIQTLDDLLNAKNDASTMTATLINHLQDDTWKEREDYFREKITNIRIESDMNPGTLKFILCELGALHDELLPHYLEQKRTYEMLTNKDFGAAHAYRIAHATGSNAEERKRTGMLSLINATIDGIELNLISLIASVQLRYTAMEEFMKSIEYKSKLCITISGAMKIESTLTNGQV